MSAAASLYTTLSEEGVLVEPFESMFFPPIGSALCFRKDLHLRQRRFRLVGSTNLMKGHHSKQPWLLVMLEGKTAEVISKVLLLSRDEELQDPAILEQIRAGV